MPTNPLKPQSSQHSSAKPWLLGLCLLIAPAPLWAQSAQQTVNDTCVWVDRFGNPGQSELGGYWFSFDDQPNQGKSSLSPKEPKKGVTRGEFGMILRMMFQLDKGNFKWDPYAGWGVQVPSLPVAWDSVQAIAYEYRGAGHILAWQTGNVEDYGYFQQAQEPSKEWKSIRIPIQQLKQPFWAKPVAWDFKASKALVWQVTGKTGDKGGVEIANVRFIRGVIPKESPKAPITPSGLNYRSKIDSSKWLKVPYGKISIPQWPNDAKGAFSLSFDDGYQSHIDHLQPLLAKYKIPASFYLITSVLAEKDKKAQASYTKWQSALNLALDSHEVASHTLRHANLTEIPLGSLEEVGSAIEELEFSRDLISGRLEKPVLTLAYPYGATNPMVQQVAEGLYIGARGVSGFVNPGKGFDFHIQAASFDLSGERSLAKDLAEKDKMIARIEQEVLKNGDWGVFYGHEVLPFDQAAKLKDSWQPMSTESLDALFGYLDQKRSSGELWINTLANVQRWRGQRNLLRSGVISADSNTFVIQLDDGLPNAVYDIQMPMEITVPADWKRVKITGANGLKITKVRDGKVEVEALPFGQLKFEKVKWY